jgi:hypothetical protein
MGVLALSLSQGSVRAGLTGVAAVVAASVLAAGVASIRVKSSN